MPAETQQNTAGGIKNKTLFYIFIFWGFYGLFEIVSSFVYYTESSIPFSWNERFIARLPVYLSWTLFVPFIYNFSLKHKFEKSNVLRSVFKLALSGVLIAILHRITAGVIVEVLQGIFLEKDIDLNELLISKKFILIAFMFDSYLMYWMIIAVIFSFDYYRKFNENRVIASELQSKLNLAELDLLKMQIHPHFLFNTLNTISVLVHKDPEAADKMISQLSSLLRTSLDYSGRQFVTLGEELSFLDLYLEIQKVRFNDRLEVRFKLDPSSLELPIPAVILQPVVENSIKHVLEKSKDVCLIEISSSVKNEKLILDIKDNGNGVPEDKNIFNEGVGLSNVRSRLAQIYNISGSLKVKNLNGSGFLVSIIIPLHTKKDPV